MPRRPTRFFPEYGPLLPMSGPDWRWARAMELVTSEKNASLNRDGRDIVRAIRFIRTTMKDHTGKKIKRLLKIDPDLVMAVKFRNEGGRRELELQCRMLARQRAGVIALEMGLTKTIVETYCLMFFDVADRLGAKSYISRNVIGMQPAQPPTSEMLMMACAYHHGPLMIGPWLDFLDHQGEAHDLKTDIGRQREALELLEAVHGLPNDDQIQSSLLKRAKIIFETRPKMFRDRSVEPGLSKTVSQLLGELSWQAPTERGDLRQHPVRTKQPSRKMNPMSQTA